MSQLDDLAADLDRAVEDALDEAEKIVGKGSNNIKQDAKQRVTGYSHLPHYPRSITYDVDRAGNTVSSEIGPDANRRQGPLGYIIEQGTVNNAPIPHLYPALDAEEPAFVRYIEDLGEKLLKR
jgi:bacteriophage HK97-gp10 putative tail-component